MKMKPAIAILLTLAASNAFAGDTLEGLKAEAAASAAFYARPEILALQYAHQREDAEAAHQRTQWKAWSDSQPTVDHTEFYRSIEMERQTDALKTQAQATHEVAEAIECLANHFTYC